MCRTEANYLGNKSMTYTSKLTNQNTDETLVHNETVIVFFNKDTGKADNAPDALQKHFTNQLIQAFQIAIDTPPSPCFSVDRYVTLSDYDHCYHVNALSYGRWCMDAAAIAVQSNALPSLHDGDITDHLIEDVEMRHFNETFAPDKVSIKVWECPVQKNTLLFWIDKIMGDKVEKVFFARIKFHHSD